MHWMALSDGKKQLTILEAMLDEEPTTAARLAVKLEDETYRKHLHHSDSCGCDYINLKNEVRLTLFILHRDRYVLREKSNRPGRFGPYKWSLNPSLNKEELRQLFIELRAEGKL